MNSNPDLVYVDDRSAEVGYFPATKWQHKSQVWSYEGTYSNTFSPGAYITFAFNDRNSNHGEFSIAMDGRHVYTNTSYAPTQSPTLPLFTMLLNPGQHTIKISNAFSSTALALDYFVYMTDASTSPDSRSGGSNSSLSTRVSGPYSVSHNSGQSASGNSSKTGNQVSKVTLYSIVGLISALVTISALGALLVTARRRARARRRQHSLQPFSDVTHLTALEPLVPEPPPYAVEPAARLSAGPSMAAQASVKGRAPRSSAGVGAGAEVEEGQKDVGARKRNIISAVCMTAAKPPGGWTVLLRNSPINVR
ncbi:hypothetical protein AURDEDRAFT_123915 [Auricularia subglabra TFB-10046 SS5]|nr:hypothetical protein AURDEDRAFT_123915 [Auricularia subglabra TFB-10046 SS5]